MEIETTRQQIDFKSEDRILYLTKDPELIIRQLNGENLNNIRSSDLLDRISTDAYPTRACFRFENAYMASQALTGLSLGKDRWFPENGLKEGNFSILVAGSSFGCGSSREHFPLSLKAAGVELIVASSIERICIQNCQNIGLKYIEGVTPEILRLLQTHQNLSIDLTLQNLDDISAEIVLSGGLFNYLKNTDIQKMPKPKSKKRPMTGPEKIIAEHMNVEYVQPGDTGFIQVDKRYSYEIFTPLSEAVLKSEVPNSRIEDPNSVFLFYDHSVLDNSADAYSLARRMREFAKRENIKLYDGNQTQGTEGICHTIMLDRHALPGEIILGTDSHTCTLGAVGALPIGVGATEWAAALWKNMARISVPQSILFKLEGKLPPGVMAKDVMLYILSNPYIQEGQGIGKIFEFDGSLLETLSFDEQVVFPNMAVEGGGFSGYINPNRQTANFLLKRHALLDKLKLRDIDAEYAKEFLIDVSNLEPYVALPGDPKNGLPISKLTIPPKIEIAYIGSCTGGKLEDILSAAHILQNKQVNPNVRLYVQTSSRSVFEQAQALGLIDIISKSGGVILPPGCGACVNFGPGSSLAGEVTISDTNRNFPGRMGKGETYLANPAVVAASAIAGRIVSPISL